jgi:single-strand DNA-binding protein
MNRVILIGFLGKDAEIKTTRQGAAFTVLSLATSWRWRNRETGEFQSQTTWHRCIAWGKLGTFAASLTKGAQVQLEGEIRTRQYSENLPGRKAAEVTKSITEVRVTSLTELDRTKNSHETPLRRRGPLSPGKAQEVRNDYRTSVT